jgi:5-methylcytosine-specific restriction enzyme subunit McrC
MPTAPGGDRQRLPVSEYGSATVPESLLTLRDIAALDGISNELVTCGRVLNGWELRVGPTCGVIQLDRCEIEIRPKLMPDGHTVVSWISYALRLPVAIEATRRWSVGCDGIRDVVIAALLGECERLLRDGLRRDYLRREAVDTVLRGRLDIPRQISRRYGQVDRLHLHRFDRDTAVWPNLVCHAALSAAARLASSVDLRRGAAELAAAFPACAELRPTVLRWLATARYHRMNARYRAAHAWAGLVLGGGGVTDFLLDGVWNAQGLLINMNRLWEAVISRLSAQVSEQMGGAPVEPARLSSIKVEEAGHPRRPLRLDALISLPSASGERLLLPVDAKYKSYDREAISAADTHQLLTYATAYRTGTGGSTAVLVYPANKVASVRRLCVRGPAESLGNLALIGVDVRRSPDEAGQVIGQAVVDAMGQRFPTDSRARHDCQAV